MAMGENEGGTVSASPYVLVEDLLPILHGLRRGNRTGATDDADLIFARALAKALWAKGWRNKNVRPDLGQQNLLGDAS